MLEKRGKKVDLVVNLTTPEEEIIERIVNRRICSNHECKTVYNLILHPPVKEEICDVCGHELIQRKDDTIETVKSRLDNYFKQTMQISLEEFLLWKMYQFGIIVCLMSKNYQF